MYLNPTAGCQISTLIFENKIVEGGLYKYPMENISRTAKFFSTWNLDQRYCPGLQLTLVPGWVSAQQGVRYQI